MRRNRVLVALLATLAGLLTAPMTAQASTNAATSFRVYALGAGCADVLYATMGNGHLRWLKYDESEHRWFGPYTIGYGWV